jgi:RNA-directed DNA polymerase
VGNLTSQFFANIYLNQLDHYIKQSLGYHAYVRYMDDFILWSDDPIDLKEALKKIEQFVQQQLDLRIKPKSVQINRVTCGIPYLGYRIFPKLLRIRKENLKRCLKGIEKTEQAYIQGKISADVLYQSTRSRMGFIGYAHSTHMLQSIWGRNQQAGLTV